MVNAIRWDHATTTAFTITVASLASSTAGVGRQSTMLDNSTNWYRAAKIMVEITTGTTPTINTTFFIYLLRRDDHSLPNVADDNAGGSDAGITIVNAPLIGVMRNNTATSDTTFRRLFTTEHLGPLGPSWGIAIVHDTGVNLNSTAGNHDVRFQYYNPEIQ